MVLSIPAAVLNHWTFLLTLLACCILPVVSHLSVCLFTACNYLPVLCVYCRQPSLPHTPCSPVSHLLISPTFTPTTPPPPLKPLHLIVCGVLRPWSKTMNIFRNLFLETTMQKLTAASWLVSTNLKKEGRVITSLNERWRNSSREWKYTHTSERRLNTDVFIDHGRELSWRGGMLKYGAIILLSCVECVHISKPPNKHMIEKKLKYAGNVKSHATRNCCYLNNYNRLLN